VAKKEKELYGHRQERQIVKVHPVKPLLELGPSCLIGQGQNRFTSGDLSTVKVASPEDKKVLDLRKGNLYF